MKKSLLLLSSLLMLGISPTALAQDASFYEAANYQTVYDSGVYKIGSTLDAGAYRIIANSEYGMYVVSSDANQETIIDFSPVSTHSYVEVKDGDYLQLDSVFAVPIEGIEPIQIINNSIADGTYSVGFDIPEGEYEVTQSEEHAMLVVYGSLDKNDIVNFSPITNNAFVEVSEGQYLQLDGATITDDRLATMKNEVVSSGDKKTINSKDEDKFVKGELLEYMEESKGHEFSDEELEETMNKYNRNVLNAKFFKDIGVVEYIHDKETFELTLTHDNLKSTLNAYIIGTDIDPETWAGLLEVFEKISGTIANDMGTNYTLSVIRPNSTDAILVYRDGKVIENDMDSGDKFINQ